MEEDKFERLPSLFGVFRIKVLYNDKPYILECTDICNADTTTIVRDEDDNIYEKGTPLYEEVITYYKSLPKRKEFTFKYKKRTYVASSYLFPPFSREGKQDIKITYIDGSHVEKEIFDEVYTAGWNSFRSKQKKR